MPDRIMTSEHPANTEGTLSHEKGPGAGLAGEEEESASDEEDLPVVETPSSCYISSLAISGSYIQEPSHPNVPTSQTPLPDSHTSGSNLPPAPHVSTGSPLASYPRLPSLVPPVVPLAQRHHLGTAPAIIKVQPFIHGDSAVFSSLVETKSLRGYVVRHWRALLVVLGLVLALILILGIGLGVGLGCSGKFRCTSSQVCVHQSSLCDAVKDCPHGDDELNCVRVSGRGSVLQVCSKGAWWTVCSTGGNSSSLGHAACRQLGYDSYSSYSSLPLSSVEPFLQTGLVLVNLNLLTLQPSISIQNPTLLSKTQCSSGNVTTLSCLDCSLRPRLESRIVGGAASPPGHLPWMASLHHKQTPTCGAAVITHTWILTAAHCVYGFDDPGQWVVYVGLTAQPINGAGSLSVKRIVYHDLYRPRRTEYDIALIRLEQPLSFNGLVKPICLPNHGEQLEEGRSCQISGWGATQIGGEPSVLLQSAQVQVLSSTLCEAPSSPWSLCAGHTPTGPHSCLGDNGGPLACEGESVWKVWGVLGWSYGCGENRTGELYTQG
ncbi:transmembrane protease serine 3 isoform X2 [Osmerus mordax]|uniref:transmembrane protease serine 3 isoform X2 n=1 Tax=Osmerus mordax TaxID=8014 RepID=UPI00350F69E8